eukprot:CAMPEP_0178817712 /NCGR_PEP_ID=MMETSP0746-20121128/2039_1 /TAXON_ID=913974 /ORGANISM="Nitzschia punctata, Strain CCMP561" /LENGTH=70 /DNA_ID=CAMNT_0020478837 /DNA_START=224 /DNA_END=436 /DNA_ORIENTATION=+
MASAKSLAAFDKCRSFSSGSDMCRANDISRSPRSAQYRSWGIIVVSNKKSTKTYRLPEAMGAPQCKTSPG